MFQFNEQLFFHDFSVENTHTVVQRRFQPDDGSLKFFFVEKLKPNIEANPAEAFQVLAVQVRWIDCFK